MTAAFWFCLSPDCSESGTTTATESGADKRHADATGHGTSTSARGEWVTRRCSQ